MPVYYTAPDGRCGDFVPFYWDGVYHLYYLHARGLSHVTTPDFIRFEEQPQALAPGGEDDPDWMVATGSVIERNGRFWLYYCGDNPAAAQHGGLGQVILRAWSGDLQRWTRDSAWRLEPPLERYTPVAWRDPQVLWMPERGEYWMLVTAQLREGPGKALADMRRTELGCVALYASPNLEHWQERAPLYTPGWFDTAECPDLFRLGNWWYLTWNEYRDIWSVHYRMARSPEGPWLAPDDDMFDGRAFYAAKTVTDGRRRLLAGWLCTKEKGADAGNYEWGGSLLVHALRQRADGTLGAGLPLDAASFRNGAVELVPRAVMGGWEIDGGVYRADARQALACLRLAELPARCLAEADIRWSAGTRCVGLALRADDALTDWYMLMLEPGRGLLKFDRWLRAWDYPWLERPLRLGANQAHITVLMADSEMVLYVDDTLALSGRMYDLRGGALMLVASEGQAEFSNCALSVY